MTRPSGPRAFPHRTALQRINADVALAAIEAGGGYALHRPMHVAIQVASACNLDCYMCLEHTRPEGERHGRTLRSFPRALFDRLVDDVLPYSSRLTFGIGGEPTLAQDFEHFLRRGFELGQEIELVTNATRFDQGTMAETIAQCVSYLQVSIDAATPANYERIRKGAKLARVIANLELLNRHRAEFDVRERTHVSFWVTLLRSAVHELPQIVELAHRLGIDRVHAHHVTPITPEGAADALDSTPCAWNEARARAIDRARELGIDLDVPEPLPDPASSVIGDAQRPAAPVSDPRAIARASDPRNARAAGLAVACHLPTSAFYVLWDGTVAPCCHPYAQEKMRMGDLRAQSFADVWNGDLYRNLRAGMRCGDVLCICRNCPVVHDRPISLEAEEEMRASPTLAEHFAGRDLDPADTARRAQDPLARLREGAALAELDDLRLHARNLEAERPHLKGHISNLEAERPHLLGHIANLERELALARAGLAAIEIERAARERSR